MKDLTDLDLNKQSDDNMHIASKLQSVELLKDMKVGETYKASVLACTNKFFFGQKKYGTGFFSP